MTRKGDSAVRLVRVEDRALDARLVEEARTGSLDAKRELFERHVPMASALAFRLLGSDTELEDIVQDSFIAAFSQLTRLEEPHAFRSWLAAIVTSTAIATLRRRSLLSRLGLRRREPVCIESLLAEDAAPDVIVELRGVCRAIESLPADERITLVLRRFEQLSLEQIADQTRTSLATVKRRLTRAEARLARALGNPEDKS